MHKKTRSKTLSGHFSILKDSPEFNLDENSPGKPNIFSTKRQDKNALSSAPLKSLFNPKSNRNFFNSPDNSKLGNDKI